MAMSDGQPDRVLIIIPVGTSLLTNKGGAARASSLGGYYSAQQIADNSPGDRTAQSLRDQLYNQFIADGRWMSEIGYRSQGTSTNQLKDILPQELSYLALLPSQSHISLTWRPKPLVALLASDSPQGRLCAQVIHEIVKAHGHEDPWNAYEVCNDVTTVQGLCVVPAVPSEPVHETFCQQGIPNLAQCIHKLRNEHSPRDVILNITGGFKGAVPYTTLAALLLDTPPIRLHYLFEDTDKIIELPVYPIGLDFPRWHRERNLMEAAVRRPEVYRPCLDSRVRAVVDEHKLWKTPGSVPYLLKQQYESQRDKDPLQIYSQRVIAQFLPEGFYRQRLLDLIGGPGPLIWYGDRVPMAAEHAARHHHHVLELAQLVLTPIAGATINGEPFLNEHERFVLLAALLLHDCGHTVGALPLNNREHLVPLFPSEVRDLHHFLAWHRLKQGDARETIGWDPDAPLASEVAWLCLYHRASMGWGAIEGKRGRARCPFLDLSVPAPLGVVDWVRCEYKNCSFAANVDFPKLVALLRAIDGLDIQAHRVGPGPSAEVMQATFAAQAQIARSSMKGLLPAADALLACRCGEPWDKARAFCKDLASWLSGNNASKPPQDATFWNMREQMAQIIADPGDDLQRAAAAAWTELARAFDEFCVRDRQFIHFAKHNAVAAVSVLPTATCDIENGRWLFDVTLHSSPQYRAQLDCRAFAQPYQADMSNCDTLRQWIESEIKGELASGPAAYLCRKYKVNFKLDINWDDAPAASAGA